MSALQDADEWTDGEDEDADVGGGRGRVKRVMANRQSAQRSRMRKLQFISDLEAEVMRLQGDLEELSPTVAALRTKHAGAQASCTRGWGACGMYGRVAGQGGLCGQPCLLREGCHVFTPKGCLPGALCICCFVLLRWPPMSVFATLHACLCFDYLRAPACPRTHT